MAHIDCVDCLTTYRPYKYVVALLRVLMRGFSDWWEFEDEWVIEVQFRKYCRDRTVRSWLIDKMRTYIRDDSFAGDFNFHYLYLETKRRTNILATFLCFDCEIYYCRKCYSKHSGHFTLSKDDKYNISTWGGISVDMLEKLNAEGDKKLENMKHEKTLLCDIVDVKCEHDKLYLHHVLWELEQQLEEYDDQDSYEFMSWEFEYLINPSVLGLHISNDNKKWLVTDDKNKCVKIFSVNDNKMTRCIKLSSPPHIITEIPSTDSSPCLIAVSFPWTKQINIINIHSTPAHVISSINVKGRCYDLAYCNNKLITRCKDNLGGKNRHLIHVRSISGEIINIIDLHNLPGFKLERLYSCRMSVHSESETIYVCHDRYPSCVISLSLGGQVLHSVTFIDLEPALIHVDKDQNVYVMSRQLPIYKLSADLRQREIIDKDVVEKSLIKVMRFHNDKFYLATDDGHVYIIQHDSSCGHNQHKNVDENRLFQYASRAEQLNPTI